MNISAQALQDIIENKVQCVRRMGLKVLDIRRGYLKLSMPLKGNENHFGGMYAGILFTLAEIPGGAILLTSFDPTKYYPVVKEMTIQFFKPALTDVSTELTLPEPEARRIEAEAMQDGKSEFILEAELKDTSGTVVCRTRGVYQIRAVGR